MSGSFKFHNVSAVGSYKKSDLKSHFEVAAPQASQPHQIDPET